VQKGYASEKCLKMTWRKKNVGICKGENWKDRNTDNGKDKKRN